MGKGIGKVISDLRIRAGYETLGQLSRDTGITVATLSRIENGIQRPSPDTLSKLAPYLRVKVEYLMAEAGYLPDKKNVQLPRTDLPDDPAITDLLKQVKDLTAEERESLLEHWRFALDQAKKIRERRRRK